MGLRGGELRRLGITSSLAKTLRLSRKGPSPLGGLYANLFDFSNCVCSGIEITMPDIMLRVMETCTECLALGLPSKKV